LNSSPVDIPSAPDCIASSTKPSIAASCSGVGAEPETPAASRTALWPTNQAKFGVWPTSERNSRCSPKVDHGIVGLSNPNECRRLRMTGSDAGVTGA
jgi:hypothetical protein